jgi:hypothetical protein
MKSNNLLIEYKHDKKIYVIEDLSHVIIEENYLMFVGTRGR